MYQQSYPQRNWILFQVQEKPNIAIQILVIWHSGLRVHNSLIEIQFMTLYCKKVHKHSHNALEFIF